MSPRARSAGIAQAAFLAAVETRLGQMSTSQLRKALLVWAEAAAPGDRARLLKLLGAKVEAAQDRVQRLAAELDWLEETKRAFPPLWVGRFLVHGSHWQRPVRDGAIALEIDAASAFGTGEHPSTSGCLLALDGLARRRRFRAPLDIGTGSGILAIAAARRLARRVRASDIDAESVRVARHHVRRNGLAATVRVECAPGFRSRSLKGRHYDLIFANILARPLAQMARDLSRAIAPGGIVILSGLLTRQEAYVLAAYRRCGLRLVRRITIGEWSTLILGSGVLGAG